MNAFAMKLESRQQLTFTTEERSKEFNKHKKCKGLKKRNVPTNIDKDALYNNYGLGRKFCDEYDLNSVNLNISKSYICKKNRPKKSGVKIDKMFAESEKIQEKLQQSLNDEDKEKISSILNEIRSLSDIEKLFLYLQLPTGSSFEVDPLKQKNINPLGKKADEEGMFAITWIQSHLEEDPDVSLPKQEVYDEYHSYCNLTGTDPLCAADFGKVMKQIFPSVKPRRLGTRGNSRYCYSGLRKKLKLESPSIPDIQKEKENSASEENVSDEVTAAACHLLFEWAEKLLGIKFNSLKELAAHLLENMYVDNRSVAAFTILLDASPQLLSKGCIANDGGKKSEAQFHLQRKIQEKELIKEQKRKLQEQRTNCVNVNRGKGVPAKKKNIKSRKARLPSEEFGCDNNQEENDMKKCEEILLQAKKSEMADTESDAIIPEINIKEEDNFTKSFSDEKNSDVKAGEQAFSNIHLSPLSSPSDIESNGIGDTKMKVQNVSHQSKPPVHIAQSLPGIIIVPSLPQIAAEIGKQNPNPPKYKRIQPKPLQGELFSTIVRSRAGSVGSSLPIKPKSRNVDGRRSSHACLQSDCFVDKSEEKSQKSNAVNGSVSFNGSVQEIHKSNVTVKENPTVGKSTFENINDSCFEKRKEIPKLHIKPRLILQSGQASDLVEIEESNSAKRHLDENDDHIVNKRVHLELSNEPIWTQDFNNPLNKHIGIGHEEVNVHEIEGDALNDYFRGANNHTSISSFQQNDLEQQISTTNKVKQLSQLRMLLEQNLPSAISKTVASSVKTHKVSKSVDTNENTLSSLSPALQESSKTLMCNTIFENPMDSSGSIDNPLKNDPQMDTLEKMLSLPYLPSDTETNMNSQMLSDPNIFMPNNIQAMDVSLQNELNQNSRTNDIMLSSTLLSDADIVAEQVNTAVAYRRVSTCTQVPSVPQSPNTRRRAFNFMPISPRHTPIPDGVATNGTSSVSSPHLRMMMSTGVGPSQPPSNSGSPFVSPRSTPVPLSRSRHSSGQSTYSTSCHTPFQNFDSGVSSVSTSPFISPQPTPIPVSRLRHNSSHGSSKTVTFYSVSSPQVIQAHSVSSNMRTRHSSGPGAPCSSSLSPLVMEQSSTQSFIFPSSSEIRSRHNSGSNATTPLSPVSEQASSSSSCTSNIPDFSGVNDLSQSLLNDGAGDILISANPSSFKQVRQRHVSSSAIYGKSSYTQRDILSQEIQKLLKNSQESGTSDLLLSNRSQSVPLHQMLQTADGLYFLQSIEDSCPKSHPSTPVMNQMFTFPSVGTNQEAASLSLAVDIGNRDKSIVQNSQMEWTGLDGSTELETSSVRRNLAALYDAPPLSDDLQTTLEDLRDCDTDFSKLELELKQSEECGL